MEHKLRSGDRSLSFIEKFKKNYHLLILFFCYILVPLVFFLPEATAVRVCLFFICFIGQSLFGISLSLKANKIHKQEFLQVVAVGVPVGMVASTVIGQLTLALGLSLSGYYLSALAGFILFFWQRTTLSKVGLDCQKDFSLYIAVGLLLSIPALLTHFRRNPHVHNGIIQYDIDVPYLAAVSQATSVWHGGVNPLYSGEPLRYPWLIYGWVNLQAQILNLSDLLVLTRILPWFGLLGIIIGTISVAMIIDQSKIVPIMALLLVLIAIPIGDSNFIGSSLRMTSPSQFMSYSWTLGVVIVYLSHFVKMTNSCFSFFCFAIIYFGVSGGKISAAAVLGGAIICVSVVQIVKGDRIKDALCFAFLATIIPLTTFFLFIWDYGKGADKGGDLSFGPGLSWNVGISYHQILNYPILPKIVLWSLVSFAGLLGIMVKVSSLIFMLRVPGRASIEEVFAWFVIGIGTLTTIITYHRGHSQLYFVQTALTVVAPIVAASLFRARGSNAFLNRFFESHLILSGVFLGLFVFFLDWYIPTIFPPRFVIQILSLIIPILAILISLGIVSFLQYRNKLKVEKFGTNLLSPYSLALVLTVASIFAGFLYQTQTYTENRVREEAHLKSYKFSNGWTRQHESAMTVLKERTNSDDIIATNRFCRFGEPIDKCGGISFVVSALTGRKLFVEGHYWDSDSTSGSNPPFLVERMKSSLLFVEKPSKLSWRNLRSYGVTWVVIDKEFSTVRNWEPFGTIQFENQSIALVKLKN